METERKYLHPPMQLVRSRLRQLCATTSGAHFESNVVLDNGELGVSGSLLRLRTQEWPDRSRYVLTFKFRPPDAARLEAQGIKAREELEIEVSDGALLATIFGHLGFRPVARYEKMREEWHLSVADHPCAVALDTLPFAEVAEIEASPSLIDPLAKALALDNCKFSPKNYYELKCELTDSSAPDILFSPADREAIRAKLHLQV